MTDRSRIGISTWSLRHHLGTTYPHDLSTTAIGRVEETFGAGTESLLDLPSALANRGYRRLDLASFHLPSRDPLYLGELRAQLLGQNVTLQTLLIEAGDISHPVEGARDTGWIAGWIEIANELGAQSARIVAGRGQPTREALDRATAALGKLADANAGSPVRLVTSNDADFLATPDDLFYVLDHFGDRIGLLADFDAWTGPAKYSNLAAILGRAQLCHAGPKFPDGVLAREDFTRCLDLAATAGYAGPYALIVDDDVEDEWAALEIARDLMTNRPG